MSTFHASRAVACAVGVALAGGAAAVAAQSEPALSTLTVPAANLPAGCKLGEARPTMRLMAPSGVVAVPMNPWSGTEPVLKAAVRSTIDGAPSIPDAPPPDRREIGAIQSRWAADVAEAYRAEYQTAADERIFVSAVRYTDAAEIKAAALPGTSRARPGTSARIVHGARVIQLSGAAGECFQAIKNYLQSAK